jgi:ubiquinone/menaquinone biosynthesis C-methylase UbiE/uncharacterized protein YbaR (Trm112 family)
MKQRTQDFRELLPYIRCTGCGGHNLHEVSDLAHPAISGITLSGEGLGCSDCEARYPVTVEGIPIMWSDGLRSILTHDAAATSDSNATLASNIEVYDEISDHYIQYIRQDVKSKSRITAAFKEMKGMAATSGTEAGDRRLHVDFGCGPGNVLIWSEDWAAERNIQRVGVDVSIRNLQNVLNRTDALVILGDATNMPIRDNLASIVSEGSVLHHIHDWKAVISECCRISNTDAVILLDNEPSKESLDWSLIARAVFASRFYVYSALSYVLPKYRNFRSIKLAKLNYYQAEVHNQPGLGFDPDEIAGAFANSGFRAEVFRRCGSALETGSGSNPLQVNVLLALSGKNWKDPRYGVLTIVAQPSDSAA